MKRGVFSRYDVEKLALSVSKPSIFDWERKPVKTGRSLAIY
jgi:hypothetical protein